MAAVLRIDSGDVNLGNPFEVYAAFADIAQLADPDTHPELFQVLDATEDEEPCEPQWLAKVAKQATDVLAENPKMPPSVRTLLVSLSNLK